MFKDSVLSLFFQDLNEIISFDNGKFINAVYSDKKIVILAFFLLEMCDKSKF